MDHRPLGCGKTEEKYLFSTKAFFFIDYVFYLKVVQKSIMVFPALIFLVISIVDTLFS